MNSINQPRRHYKPICHLDEKDKFLLEFYSEQIEKLYCLISAEEPVRLLVRKQKQLASELKLFNWDDGKPNTFLLIDLLNFLNRQERTYIYGKRGDIYAATGKAPEKPIKLKQIKATPIKVQSIKLIQNLGGRYDFH